ncbi:alpha/beta hydrolase [Bacterioplanoides sp.]|uniref:alpha/beta hydrolase n=1 Tax=Bacterioplanoides sp. TaxID=2066072 RepID=UPI003B5B38EA
MASLMARITGTLIQKLVQPTFQPDYPIARQRKRLDFLQKFAPMPLGVEKIEITLAGIPAWRLTPLAASKGKQLLYLHGGGYVSGSPQSHGDMVARIAKQTGLTTTLIDYRLAPENVFPAAVDDALIAYKELIKDGSVVIAGDSAGGGLSLAVTQAIRDAELPMPDALVLFSPWIDLNCSGESFSERAEREKLLTPDWVSQMAPKYAGEAGLTHPQVSPLNADFKDFPPTLIQVGSEEILYSDSIRLQEKMAAANVSVVLSEYPEMWHVFQLHAGYMPEAKQALKEFAAFIDG